jgi:ElaB/YqjD/DUF883 family membrane-anchored ribosome-binding protein
MDPSTERLRNDIERIRADLGTTLDAIGDRVSPRAMATRTRGRMRLRVYRVRDAVMGRADGTRQSVSSSASDVSTRVSTMASDAAETARETSAQMAERAQQGIQHGVDTIRQAPERIEEQTRGNPIAAGLVVFGLGMLAASLIPATRAEEDLAAQAAGPMEPILEGAKEQGRELAGNLKSAAQDAVQDVKQSASEAGSTVAEETKQAASSVAHQ